jgi:glycosyltransferase involved in cell wall biosynthesis
MKRHVEQSFLSDYPIYVVPNGIDFNIYYYMSNPSPARIGITTNKKIILGVAAYWTQRKGLNDFLELSRILPENYQIVLVGVSARQQKRLPRNVIGIRRTENRQSLVQLYSSSLVFINPSREESFSMVTVEAMACGLPVIALDTTAVKELIEEDVGIVLHQPSAEDYLKAIHQVENKIRNGQMTQEGIVRYAQRFSVQTMTDQILALYQKSLTQ